MTTSQYTVNRFRGLKALVTGGTRGIGYAIACRLREEGANVIITGQKEKPSHGNNFEYYGVNFEDRKKTEIFADSVKEMAIDVLINNAGINKIDPITDIKISDFDRIQDVNVRAPFLLLQAVLPHMKKNGWGRVVNIGSIFGVITKENRGSYSASKFALGGLTKTLATEVASTNILANCVAPGFVDTDLTRKILDKETRTQITQKIPLRRFGNPTEISAFVAWLASVENTYLTGQTIVIDGGFSIV